MKVRAADAQLLPKRSIYHQDSGEMIKDFLKYDEVPGVTNCSTVSLPPNMLIHKHVHPSKYEIFLTVGGSGFFKVWAPGAADGDDPREVFRVEARGVLHRGTGRTARDLRWGGGLGVDLPRRRGPGAQYRAEAVSGLKRTLFAP